MPGPILSIAIKHDTKYLWVNDNSIEFREIDKDEIWAPNLRFFVPIGCECFIQAYNRKIVTFDGENCVQVKDVNNGVSKDDMFNLEFVAPNKVKIRLNDSSNKAYPYWKRDGRKLVIHEQNDDSIPYENTIFEIENIFI